MPQYISGLDLNKQICVAHHLGRISRETGKKITKSNEPLNFTNPGLPPFKLPKNRK